MKDTPISFSQWPCSWIFKPTCYLKTQKPTACRNIYNLSDLAFSHRKQMFMQVARVKAYIWFLRHSFQGIKTSLKDKLIMFLPLLHNYQYWREAHNSYPFLWLASTNKIRKKPSTFRPDEPYALSSSSLWRWWIKGMEKYRKQGRGRTAVSYNAFCVQFQAS